MAWFHSAIQGSNEHIDSANGSGRFCTAYNRLQGLTEVTVPAITPHEWSDCASSSSTDFPSAPHHTPGPPSLENLSCSPSTGSQDKESLPISYVTFQEQRCVLSWFRGWNATQRERFMQDLLGKAVPGKVCTLLDSLSTLQVKDKLPNIFECQLRLWSQWFESWEEEERNHFLHLLEEKDPVFVAHFYKCVAGTAGKD
ncbi:uncharacterized protein C14orf119 homolog [Periophthalmus magnuspinnatus]|uniref:uncharacterized protein C14orf119 homolog n=1 Tax=Periophthalmus magnuspinnatus TaxID=409849 RepID=UPI00145A1401|nr:uncharacterized protein C14orf119 homolog [Periophthalmus magnuspinnatus]